MCFLSVDFRLQMLMERSLLSPGVSAPTLPLPSPNLMRPKFESPTAYVELRNDQ